MSDPNATRAAYHAEMADKILEGVATQQDRLRTITPEQHLELVAAGRIKQLNADLEFSVRVAHAHAVTALALQGSPLAELEEEPTAEELEAAQRPGVPAPPRTGVSGGGAITTADVGASVKRGGRSKGQVQ